jgi:hypothetical protein
VRRRSGGQSSPEIDINREKEKGNSFLQRGDVDMVFTSMASSTIKTQAAKFDLHRARSASRVTRDRPSARLNQKTHQ